MVSVVLFPAEQPALCFNRNHSELERRRRSTEKGVLIMLQANNYTFELVDNWGFISLFRSDLSLCNLVSLLPTSNAGLVLVEYWFFLSWEDLCQYVRSITAGHARVEQLLTSAYLFCDGCSSSACPLDGVLCCLFVKSPSTFMCAWHISIYNTDIKEP